MEEYKPLNQADDESEEPPRNLHVRKETRCSLPSWSLWFASGFFAAIATVMIVTAVYSAIHKKGPPPGLIPDCKWLLAQLIYRVILMIA